MTPSILDTSSVSLDDSTLLYEPCSIFTSSANVIFLFLSSDGGELLVGGGEESFGENSGKGHGNWKKYSRSSRKVGSCKCLSQVMKLKGAKILQFQYRN